MKKHFNIKVSGTVQGVFFRASTKEKAEALGIKGFVKNERDGSVYIEAEGEWDQLNEFITWCRIGPEHAVVERCEVNESALRNFANFSVSR